MPYPNECFPGEFGVVIAYIVMIAWGVGALFF